MFFLVHLASVLNKSAEEIGRGESAYYYGNSMTALAADEHNISVRFTIIDTCDQVPPVCDSCATTCVTCGQSESCNWGIDPIDSGWKVTNF